ncbi:MAG: MBOAT family protein [Bacteroidales bacterium]|nr:MBOAT family protein [Bacteroidales bacterium]
MVFTSLNFLLFFPSVAVIYYITPSKYRWIILLVASYFFYINIKPIFILLVAGVTASTYLFTCLIDITSNEAKKRNYMIINIILILLPLFFFKYFGAINNGMLEFMESVNLRWPLPEISLILPIGISFYTFMAIGYTIDVYNEKIRAEKNIGIVALFISFFPLILSGPIERAPSMLPQFKNKPEFNYQKAVNGFQLMLWGYFMKLVVADRLAIYLDPIFNDIGQHSGSTILLATLLYPIQVYGDLGGYTLIAIGTTKILGIDVRPNFNRPFFATSMSQFWRRWHMSLITWITDYLYTPISFGLRKFKVWGIVLALMITFLVAGIWHAATIGFIIWGTLHGIVLSTEALTKKQRSAFVKRYALDSKILYILFSMVFTYLLFAFSLLFGGATYSFSDSLLALNKIFTNADAIFLNKSVLIYASIGIALIFITEFRDEYFPGGFSLFKNKNVYIRWLSYYTVLILILLIGVFGREQFIYFQF